MSLGEYCRTNSINDSSGRRVSLSQSCLTWLFFLIQPIEYLPQHIPVQEMVAPAPLGCSPASLLPEGRLSFSSPLEGSSFPLPCSLKSHSTSRLESVLGDPSWSCHLLSALPGTWVGGASSPPGCCNSSAFQQLASGQSREERGEGPRILCNVSTPHQAAGPRLKGESC